MTGPVFSYKLRYIVGFWLVEMAISTNQKPTIYRNLYENTAPASHVVKRRVVDKLCSCVKPPSIIAGSEVNSQSQSVFFVHHWILHLENRALPVLRQRRRRWPNIKTTLGIGVESTRNDQI